MDAERVEVLDEEPEKDIIPEYNFAGFPNDVIDLIFRFGNEEEAKKETPYYSGPRNFWEAAEYINMKSSIRHHVRFFQTVWVNKLVQDLWMALKCWILVREGKAFDFEIEIHNEDRTIHIDQVKADRDVMPNGGYVNDFWLGDAYVFMYNGHPGVIFHRQIIKLCAIYVPGFRRNEEGGMSFGNPTEDDVLKVRGHVGGMMKEDLKKSRPPPDEDY